MKLHIDVDCTPEEARTFLGLPDVQPMQSALMAQLQERLEANLAATDPEVLIRTWLPHQIGNLEQLQKFFWQQFATAASRAAGGSGSSGDRES
ncbi:DUF6489 family protein [Roseospira goensis]|uniref:Ribosomal protein S1 n=1 Tax=Roseospira goensis TaxID=391922 RepID=A0A7W6S004_9PROT|nr:DUF6489 family protein [Roseospira goensis]MBB4286353.1 hypothetical protein [Roseospira goensis]